MANQEIQRAWERFIQNGSASNAVRRIVAASWERSQGYHIPVERSEAPLAREAEVVQRHSEHAELIAAARPALEQARLLLGEASSMIILTDPSGVILETAGDPRTVDFGRIMHLEQGGHWAERSEPPSRHCNRSRSMASSISAATSSDGPVRPLQSGILLKATC